MKFEVKFVRSADADVASYAAHERRLILDGIGRYLEVDAVVALRHENESAFGQILWHHGN